MYQIYIQIKHQKYRIICLPVAQAENEYYIVIKVTLSIYVQTENKYATAKVLMWRQRTHQPDKMNLRFQLLSCISKLSCYNRTHYALATCVSIRF